MALSLYSAIVGHVSTEFLHLGERLLLAASANKGSGVSDFLSLTLTPMLTHLAFIFDTVQINIHSIRTPTKRVVAASWCILYVAFPSYYCA
jgi:hypothetical protein